MKNNDRLAFPGSRTELRPVINGAGEVPMIVDYPGMTLREYYAGQALAGILAGGSPPSCTASIPEQARRLADALIAELEGGEHE